MEQNQVALQNQSWKKQTELLINTLAEKDDFKLAEFEMGLTIEKSTNGTILKKIFQKNASVTLKLIYFIVKRFNNDINSNNKLTEDQLAKVSADLVDFFKYDTLEDVVLMFKMVRQGRIGNKIWKLDQQVIFNEWIPQFFDKKAEFREDQHKRKTFNLNSKSKNVHKDFNKNIEKIRANLRESRHEKKFNWKSSTKNDFLKKLKEDVKKYSENDLSKYIALWGVKESYSDYVNILKKEKENRVQNK